MEHQSLPGTDKNKGTRKVDPHVNPLMTIRSLFDFESRSQNYLDWRMSFLSSSEAKTGEMKYSYITAPFLIHSHQSNDPAEWLANVSPGQEVWGIILGMDVG